MNYLSRATVLCILILSLNTTFAQENDRRPQLFTVFSNSISFPKPELEKVFNTAEGQVIKLSLGNNFNFTGTLVSSIQTFENLQSVIIRLEYLDNSVLGLSKRINDDKSVSYIGRIVNPKYADGFEIKSDADGNYFMNKIKTQDLIQDHE
jgi:hypothetical protein